MRNFFVRDVDLPGARLVAGFNAAGDPIAWGHVMGVLDSDGEYLAVLNHRDELVEGIESLSVQLYVAPVEFEP